MATIVVKVSTTAAQKAIKDLTRDFQKLDSSAKRSVGGINTSLRSIGVTVAGVAAAIGAIQLGDKLIDSFVATNTELEKLQVLMNGVTGSIGAGAEAFEDLLEYSKGVPFTVAAISDSFVRLKVAGMDPFAGGLDAMTNAIAAFGGSNEDLKYATLAIQQMSSKGVVSMEELRRQLAERIPSAVHDMAAGLNMTYDELIKKVSSGSLKSAGAIEALFSVWTEKFSGANEALMDTMVGATSLITKEWQLLMMEIGKTGVWESLVGSVRNISDALAALRLDPEFGESIQELGAQIERIVEAVSDPEALKKFFDFSTGSISAAAAGIDTVIEALKGLYSAFDAIPDWIKDVGIVATMIFGASGPTGIAVAATAGIAAVSKDLQELADIKALMAGDENAINIINDAEVDELHRLKLGLEENEEALKEFIGVKKKYNKELQESFLSRWIKDIFKFNMQPVVDELNRTGEAVDDVAEKIARLTGKGTTISRPGAIAVEEDVNKTWESQASFEDLEGGADRGLRASAETAALSKKAIEALNDEWKESYRASQKAVKEWEKAQKAVEKLTESVKNLKRASQDLKFDFYQDYGDIATEGMGRDTKNAETLAQIKLIKQAAAEAGRAGEPGWERQIELLKRAYELTKSIDTSPDVSAARDRVKNAEALEREFSKATNSMKGQSREAANLARAELKRVEAGGKDAAAKNLQAQQLASMKTLYEQISGVIGEQTAAEEARLAAAKEAEATAGEHAKNQLIATDLQRKKLEALGIDVDDNKLKWVQWGLKSVGALDETIKKTNELAQAIRDLPDIPSGPEARAIGGPVSAGTQYLVGESGPELFTPGATGFVTPNEMLTQSGDTVNINLSIGNEQPVMLQGSQQSVRQIRAAFDRQQRLASA